jgi:hypothetical protein
MRRPSLLLKATSMVTTIAFAGFIIAALILMSTRALGDHRAILAQRRILLDEAAALIREPRITYGRDQFPVLTGHLGDQRTVRLELVADTLVCRRLPQLWLKVTLAEGCERDRPTIGILARPTGAEFYSIVHDMPEWMRPPDNHTPLLMRGDGRATPGEVECATAVLGELFADETLKEAAITSRGVRLVRQASQGDRGAHLLLRQCRFPLTVIAPDLVLRTLAEAERLSECLSDRESALPRPAAA